MVANWSQMMGFYRAERGYQAATPRYIRNIDGSIRRQRAKELVMADRGHVFRRAFSWLPAQFASQSDAPVGAPRQFRLHRAPVHRGHRGIRRWRVADERAPARRAPPFAVPPVRGRSRRSQPCTCRAARLPPHPHAQLAARVAVRNSALPARGRGAAVGRVSPSAMLVISGSAASLSFAAPRGGLSVGSCRPTGIRGY